MFTQMCTFIVATTPIHGELHFFDELETYIRTFTNLGFSSEHLETLSNLHKIKSAINNTV